MDHDAKLEPHFNISLGMEVSVIILENGQRILKMMRWGFQFSSKEGNIAAVINAKGETIFEKPIFSKSIQNKRYLIPATGFF